MNKHNEKQYWVHLENCQSERNKNTKNYVQFYLWKMIDSDLFTCYYLYCFFFIIVCSFNILFTAHGFLLLLFLKRSFFSFACLFSVQYIQHFFSTVFLYVRLCACMYQDFLVTFFLFCFKNELFQFGEEHRVETFIEFD